MFLSRKKRREAKINKNIAKGLEFVSGAMITTGVMSGLHEMKVCNKEDEFRRNTRNKKLTRKEHKYRKGLKEARTNLGLIAVTSITTGIIYELASVSMLMPKQRKRLFKRKDKRK